MLFTLAPSENYCLERQHARTDYAYYYFITYITKRDCH